MTTQQREALDKANRHRIAQAEFKRTLRQRDRVVGMEVVREIITSPPPELAAMRVEAAVSAVTRIGDARAIVYLRRANVSPTRRLGNLTEHERLRLDLALR